MIMRRSLPERLTQGDQLTLSSSALTCRPLMIWSRAITSCGGDRFSSQRLACILDLIFDQPAHFQHQIAQVASCTSNCLTVWGSELIAMALGTPVVARVKG
jgi:hypothetical protein